MQANEVFMVAHVYDRLCSGLSRMRQVIGAMVLPLREIEKMSGAERSTKETQLAGMPAWPLLCEEWFTPCRPYIGTDLGTNVVPRRAAMCAACLQAPVEAARFLGRELLGHRRAEKGAVNKCALVLFVVHQPHATATMVTGMS